MAPLGISGNIHLWVPRAAYIFKSVCLPLLLGSFDMHWGNFGSKVTECFFFSLIPPLKVLLELKVKDHVRLSRLVPLKNLKYLEWFPPKINEYRLETNKTSHTLLASSSMCSVRTLVCSGSVVLENFSGRGGD